MQQFIKFLKFLLPYKKYIIENLISSFFITLLSLPLPLFSKFIFDEVIPNQNVSLLELILILSLIFTVFSSIIGIAKDYFSMGIAFEMGVDFRLRFYRHLQLLSFDFFNNHETGEILSRQADTQASLGGVIGLINGLFINICQLLIFPLILLLINWQLTLLSIIVLPFDIFGFHFVNKKIKTLSKELAEKDADINAKNYESIYGIKSIQSLGVEDKIFHKLKNLIQESIKLRLKLSIVQQSSSFVLGIVRAISTLVYSYVGWTNVINGTMSIGTFMAFSSYVGFFYTPLKDIIVMSQGIQVTLVHLNRFFEVYENQSFIKEREKPIRLDNVKGEIILNDVVFKYPNSDQVILNKVNLSIEPGIKLGITGPSGTGKTTLLYIIGRFYDPTGGTVYLDQINIKDIELKSLRKNISFFLQDSFIFYGTIKENITCFGEYDDDGLFQRAVKIAYVDEFVKKLPCGYDTLIGERGALLSQGQKQRIVLARIIMRNTPIIIMDEATNAIDEQSEDFIFDALDKIVRDKTFVFVTHRSSLLRKADRLLFLKNGNIIEKSNNDSYIKIGNKIERVL
ncbi:ABC transporter transmembrane domain-containing protein [Ignavibacteria bacterium 4148-Me]|uniref:ABC transporter ATP-binding protein n=1 Tax=Rosettibacter primus TaxID=3111523 RepID=UPI00336BCAFE